MLDPRNSFTFFDETLRDFRKICEHKYMYVYFLL